MKGFCAGPDNVSVVFSIGETQAEIAERRELIGFHFETGKVGHQSRYAVYTIPYWSIVLPLTLISVFLLLSKPRKSNQMKIADPVPSEGT